MECFTIKETLLSKVFGISGHSGSGKTTLIQAMLPVLMQMGVRTSVIKHTHHDFVVEPVGKDSAKFRAAGAYEVMVCSAHRYAIVRELRNEPISLEAQVRRMDSCDLILVEGFHADTIDRIEVYRPSTGRDPRCVNDPHLVAFASDQPLNFGQSVWPLNEPARIARLICDYLQIDTDVLRPGDQ